LAKEGAAVCVSARTKDDIERVAGEIRSLGGKAISVVVDVGETDQVQHMIAETVSAFGAIHILVNNAAASRRSPAGSSVLDCAEEDWLYTINGTLSSVYRCSHYALPHIIAAGGGAIVNVSSTRGLSGRRDHSAYTAAKAGVLNLTRSMALDLLEKNVRVNAVCPGYTKNEYLVAATEILRYPERRAEVLAGLPETTRKVVIDRLAVLQMDAEKAKDLFGRGFEGYPQDIANAILFLASDEAAFINGETLVVDGGSSAGK
jgi:3-oxoacyl-[acyl-carrier protein] reductase